MDRSKEIIEIFKFVAYQAMKVVELQDELQISFSLAYRNAPAYELLNLIDQNPDLKDKFIECIKDFIGEVCEREKPLPEKNQTAPYELIEFLMHILQWEEIYNYIITEYKKAERPIFQKGFQDLLLAFEADWPNWDEFDINSNLRSVNIEWKATKIDFPAWQPVDKN